MGCPIECYCDNMAVVAVINSGRAKDKTLMHLLRCMFFVVAHLDIHIHASHVPGVENVAADELSRNCISSFLQEVPGADPTQLPGGHNSERATRLDVATLGTTVQRLLQAGLAPATQRAYLSGKKKYLSFCKQTSASPESATSLRSVTSRLSVVGETRGWKACHCWS